MPLEAFITKRFNASSLAIIDQANRIIEEYQRQGFTLTLRQLYYQFVARDLIANKQTEYKRLGSIVSDGRLAGHIDWNAIEDRTRNLRGVQHWDSPADIIDAAAKSFRYDKWENQPERVEVWIEKDALLGVIEGVCLELDVDYFACRGYSSQSEQWRAAKRFDGYGRQGQQVTVLHLGDHDPSGLDMTRDNDDRLDLLARYGIEVERLALNFDQVTQYGPPPNPTKLTDSRARDYLNRYGGECWELDALEPQVIADLIRDAVLERRDEDLWQAAVDREADAQDRLQDFADNWED